MNHPVSITKNNKTVVVDLLTSQAAHQIAQNPHLLKVAAELLATSDISGKSMWLCHDTGKSIGNSDVITTSDTDVIFYAQRSKSEEYSRFVKSKRLEPSSFISVELSSEDELTYTIVQIVVGHPVPSTPSSSQPRSKNRKYWTNHAFLWEDWPIKSSSITKQCPW